ncbi:glycosyltransferase [Nostoc sp. 'Peltigera membranacea cyanobiont' N6]|uniref:glycosyltransferase n=1 Tax=Nostoc sp. 'Peltigera membranacea cyanobiont' N6 TaxID=1261031 RepID=UPI000CF31491|nr:glycosyltransferase [Nostoc sp. 'Peltigera membranacea cyanobiont' N6]AVH64259.1 family 2 glycosyltransferase [Nostoc sp. 'Peltigera membranacea cyanobiont' N6]
MTSSNPLISVTMTTYNHEKYIGEAVESVLNQTYKNLELIIVNDGSNDKTDEIIRKFRDERITYIYQENQGTSSAINRAILDSRGKYIAFMSGDDICYPHRLETEYNYLVTSQKKVVFSWVDFIDENSQIITDSHFAENLFNHPNRTRSEILRHFFFHGNYINAVTGLIYRELLLDAGLFNVVAIQLQDFEMWLKLIKQHEIHILPDQLIKYRIRSLGENLSHPSNFIRTDFEDQQIYRRMFDDLPKELFKAAFSDKVRKAKFSDGIEYELEKAFLYLQHNSSSVQIIGCEKLFDLLQDRNILSCSISEYNFTLSDLYQLTNQIDFLNKKRLSILHNNFLLKENQLENANLTLREANYEIKRNVDFLATKPYSLDFKPVFSIIFPVFNTPEPYLKPAIESVLNQIYPYWELCIADDASTEPNIRKILEEYSQTDSRIKVIFRNENGHISRSSNSAIEIATGEFIALFDHDDLLTSDALYEVALLLNQHPDADMIYSDEDKVDDNNQFIYPTEKPDWCPDSFLSRMYTCHLGVYRRSLVNEIGGFRVGYEGSQDYDLVLRLTEKTDKIFHIPKILYHWRLHAGSTSASTTAKSYAYEAGFKALTDALSRRGEKGKILPDSNIPGHYHVRYEIDCYKLVSIIIIARDFGYIFNQCLESIFAETLYPNYEVIVIDNGSIKCDSEKIIEKWQVQQPNRFKYYSHNIPFNYSKLNNYAVTKAQGDYLLFLSSDIQVIQGDWLNVMVEQVQREGIGAVSGFLVDSNSSIQHVGLALGLGKIASHIYKGLTKIDEYETLANIALIKNVSVVTEDCLMCRRDVFESINGFDETLPILYNDVDLCLRLIGKGYKNIYLPHVKLIYQKLSSLKVQLSMEERLKVEEIAVNLMQEKWGKILEYDPCFSPHLIRSLNYNIQTENKRIRQHHSQERELHKPLVSICIPTYNGEIFIAEAINSVLCQTYPNIEIILSDDNSTDRTVEIAESFNQKLSFDFSILEHSQYGLAQNWNFCISQAKGKYIKFLFQDDLLEPTAIEEMVNLAEQDEEIGLVFSPRTLFTNTGHTVYDSNFLMHHEAKDVHKAWSTLKPIQSGQQLLLDPNILDSPINKIGEPSTVLIRKDVFEKVGLFNPEFCQLVDLEMWLRIMSQYKVGFADQVLSHFRIHPEQQTRRNTALKDAIFLDYQKLFQTIYSDTRYPEATRQQALYRYAALSEQNAELHQLRKKIAEECLNISDEQITDMYVGLLGKTHKMLVNSSIKYESLTDEEQIFVNDIVKSISQGFDQPKAIQNLLAAMLYYRADQLPLQHDLSRIPSWLINDYLQFLFSSPVHFQEPGDADNYYYYMQGWIDYLHTSILQNSDPQLWDKIVNNFVSIANFIPLYFNEHNLKDIYSKRGEIIEFLLKVKGYEVDYDFADRPISRKKIRLGVLAAHFLPGSETFAYLPIYEYISRDFEVILYSLNQTGHQLEQYCQSCANSFKLLPQDLVGQVNIIRADDLDILFIATNVTAVTNQICFLSMHRLARIQVTSGGSVVTTGMRHIDYYISGTLTDPSATAEQQYQEKLVKLQETAHCFSYGNEEENVTVKVDRESLGISEETVIFISGANFFKIIPELINTWAKIISEVPSSVLVLLPFGPNWSNSYPKKAFVNHLNKVFSKYGIPADQLIVLDPQPVPNREEVKEYFKIADVYLDSFPFAGTTSLIEPLQVNLPVIARRGTSFRSAMGAAMVQALDVPDLVADSEDSYIHLAIALGNNPKLRQQKSAQIKEKMQGNPSFLDSRSYSAKIGSLFQELFSKYLADTLSQNFRLGDINLVIFPDWLQPEDLLYQDLASVISTLTTHPDKSRLTLLIDTQNISEEEADMLLSSLTMNLLMEDDVDITEGPEISLLGKMSDAQWKTLLPRINTRIALATDNQSAIAQAKAENLPSCDVDNLIAK